MATFTFPCSMELSWPTHWMNELCRTEDPPVRCVRAGGGVPVPSTMSGSLQKLLTAHSYMND